LPTSSVRACPNAPRMVDARSITGAMIVSELTHDLSGIVCIGTCKSRDGEHAGAGSPSSTPKRFMEASRPPSRDDGHPVTLRSSPNCSLARGNRFPRSELIMQEREMAHNSNIGFFAMIGGSLLAAALLVALLVGGEIAGPNVAFHSSSSTSAR
jgi:hypothetical protein